MDHHRDLHVLTLSVPTRRSSELRYRFGRPVPPAVRAGDAVSAIVRHAISAANPALHEGPSPRNLAFPAPAPWLEALLTGVHTPKQVHLHPPGLRRSQEHRGWRSEEHTSELQSLMRISYAVFCLKKKLRY